MSRYDFPAVHAGFHAAEPRAREVLEALATDDGARVPPDMRPGRLVQAEAAGAILSFVYGLNGPRAPVEVDATGCPRSSLACWRACSGWARDLLEQAAQKTSPGSASEFEAGEPV